MDGDTAKILMLDDDEDEFLIVSNLLRRGRRRYHVDWTPRPSIALDDMRRGDHDVYLIDYRLGEQTGVEVIREAVVAGVQAPLILLTGTSVADDDIDIEALRGGAADYLSKDGLTTAALERSIRYARERAQSARLRETLGVAQREQQRLADALAQVEMQARRLRLQAESSTIFANARLEIDATVAEVARRCADVLGDACAITLLSADRQRAVVHAFAHRDPDAERVGREIFVGKDVDLERSLTGQIVRDGHARLCPVVGDEGVGPLGASQLAVTYGERYRTYSTVIVPIRASGDILGSVAAMRYRPGRPFTTDDQSLLQDIADRGGLAMQNAYLFASEVDARHAAERSADRAARLADTTVALSTARTTIEVVDAVMRHGLAAFGAFSGVVYMVDDNDAHLRRITGTRGGDEIRRQFDSLPLSAELPIASAARQREAIFCETRAELVQRFPRWDDVEVARDVQALIALPIAIEDRTFGSLGLTFQRPMHFPDADREFALAVARQCAQAIDRALLYESERRGRERATFLADAGALLASSLDYETILQNLSRLAVPRLGDWCAIELAEGEATRRLAIVHQDANRVEWARELEGRYPATEAGSAIVREVLRTGRPVLFRTITDELLREVSHDEAHLALLRESGLTSAVVVPLNAGGKTLGALTLVSAESRRHYDQSDIDFMAEVAHRAALAVENARLYQDAKQAVQVRDEFLSIASHELKTPLTSLLLQLQMIRRAAHKDNLSQKFLDKVRMGINAAIRLEDLILQLLDVSRITAGRLRLDVSPVQLDELVREVVDRFSDQAANAKAPIRLAVDEEITGIWDRMRLDQVVTNLVANAIKYGRGHPVDVEVERVGGEAVLRVIDRGIGISADQQRRIFGRFERAVGARDFGGFGLGLWIVRQIVDAFGGRVEVESEPDRGAKFTVRLPLKTATHEAAAAGTEGVSGA